MRDIVQRNHIEAAIREWEGLGATFGDIQSTPASTPASYAASRMPRHRIPRRADYAAEAPKADTETDACKRRRRVTGSGADPRAESGWTGLNPSVSRRIFSCRRGGGGGTGDSGVLPPPDPGPAQWTLASDLVCRRCHHQRSCFTRG